MNFREFLILTLVCTIWGLHFVVMKVTVGQTAPPLFYAAVRMTIVAIILLPFLKWHTGMMSKILLGGLGFGAFNYAFMFPALGMTTASAAALTIELYVPFSIILSVLFLGERIGYKKSGGGKTVTTLSLVCDCRQCCSLAFIVSIGRQSIAVLLI